MAPRKKVVKEEAVVLQLGPKVGADENVFATAHIFASFNDTFVHVTDLSGSSCIRLNSFDCRPRNDHTRHGRHEGEGGSRRVVAVRGHARRAGRLREVQDGLHVPTVQPHQLQLGINALHIKLRATGGTRTKTPGPGAQSALRALARAGMKIGRIEDVTPIPSDSTRRKGGRRGRRL